MLKKSNPVRYFLLAITILMLSATFSMAGTISMQWDPVPDGDLDGYRIYYGNVSGNYDQFVDVGNVTSYTLTGLADCTMWFAAVKAYDTQQLESENFSAEITGWARPVITDATPNTGQQGADAAVIITGSNFQSGATVEFAESGITVNSVTVNSCNDMTVNISVAPSTPLGPTDIEVINLDQVYGTGLNLFTVIEPQVPASITSNPVDTTVQEGQTATFSVTASGTAPLTYQWRRNGSDIAGAVNPSYTTPPVTPSDDGALFTCRVSNASGNDVSGAARLTVDVIVPPIVISTAPVDGASGVARTARPVVVFNVPMDPASIRSETVQLLNPDGNPIAQTSGSPQLAGDGVTVTIIPAQDLNYGTTYRIRVIGGSGGVLTTEGEPMDSTWVQSSGFTTEANASPSTVANVERTDTKPAAP
ncbi:MAG: Ig-like domain-containing protein [Acidobacteria bacterium]|uniref:Ig-like domain-containing protein n=1 Tax=Candidatus Polarisedimenticola svalbardensis TaxID=2886004 RepID=A0A8J7CCE8_9BACT|nr:Ig-like domain-containing protein [Candidatus Polarisedimenticola svalbardensis]